MNAEIEEQIRQIKMAKARLRSQIEVAKAMMPKRVVDDLYWDGAERAIKQNPQYKELIEAISYA